ncbi:acyltransferase [Pandoraea aquatica]|uniref:Acyltransferase n=1 Tax=Pandoraea aquatica TaxID=2508290 RepID=A0A5E4SJG6_9BURK|nr:acyltransferase [Pandoraea aquatica]VVD75860.1 acyltransferase [Pandoraea aquatica]
MKNIYQIDALRGIAALLVVLFHMIPFWVYVFPGATAALAGGSYLGVSVFFVISGFVMGAATQRDARVSSFLLKRVFRVYVPTVVAIALYCVITQKSASLVDIFRILPSGGFAPYYGYGTYFITWTLTYEIAFYFLYAIAMRISWRYRTEVAVGLILLNALPMQYLLTGHITFNPSAVQQVSVFGHSFLNVAASIAINPINLLFAFGLGWYRVFDPVAKRVRGIAPTTLASWLFLSGGMVTTAYFFAKGYGVFQMGFFALVLFSSFVVLNMVQGPGKPNFGWRAGKNLGKVSFSLYLCHYLAIDLRTHYLPSSLNVAWHPFIVGTAVVILTMAFYLLIDAPIHRLGNRLAARLPVGQASATA